MEVLGVDVFYKIYDYINLKIMEYRRNKLWKLIGLESYRIAREYDDNGNRIFIVSVPIGGSFAAIEKYKGIIEKSFKCNCNIEDIQKSSYVAVELEV